MKPKTIRMNSMKKLASEYIDKVIDTQEIATIDITELFLKEMQLMPKYGEFINIQIMAPVRTGKSTFALLLATIITDNMIKLKLTTKPFSIRNIARSQYELMLKTNDSKLNNVVIVIDEFDDLEETGMNSSINRALLANFSKTQAAYYRHKIYCSPSDMPDEGSNIIINVVAMDKDTCTTHCEVYYRLLKGVTIHTQLIGYIRLNVSVLLKNWVGRKINQVFYMGMMENKKYLNMIERLRREDFYVDYQYRKFAKFKLLNKHKVFRTQDLDYSDAMLNCIEQLKGLCVLGHVTNKQVKSHMRVILREMGIPTSIIGDKLMADVVDGNLEHRSNYYRYKNELIRLDHKVQQGKVNKENYAERKKILQECMQVIKDTVEKEMRDLNNLVEIKKVYYEGVKM